MAVTPNKLVDMTEPMMLRIRINFSFLVEAYSSRIPVNAEDIAAKIKFQVHDSTKKENTPSNRFTIDIMIHPIRISRQKQQICFKTMVLMEDLRLCKWCLSILIPILKKIGRFDK